MAHELPDDWRETFVEMVQGKRPLEADWFTGGPALSPMEQIEVYKNQYRLRLYDALVEEVPGLAHLLGGGVEPTLRQTVRRRQELLRFLRSALQPA